MTLTEEQRSQAIEEMLSQLSEEEASELILEGLMNDENTIVRVIIRDERGKLQFAQIVDKEKPNEILFEIGTTGFNKEEFRIQ